MTDLLNAAPCGFLTFSSESVIDFANISLLDLLEYDADELRGRRFDSILSPGGRVFYQTHLSPMLQMHGRVDEISLSLRAKSGADIPVLLNAARQERDGAVFFSAILVPMRQRRRFEEELIQARRAAEEATEGQRASNAALEEARATLEKQHAELLTLNAVIQAQADHERNIAERLQEALCPSLDDTVPGLDLDYYYQPALEEASVGGDFFDVFPLNNGRYALVVGDLAGKGLAAAAQTATVRHMLRVLLYLGEEPAVAITKLNDILASQALLTGFATLFAGVYDPQRCALVYVSCGQEPGLLLRAATPRTESLGPTGPVLGAFAGSEFRQRQVALAQGDVLVLFTDGLTEAGMDRRNMLGVDGITDLLTEETAAPRTASTVAQRLMAGVEAFATSAGIRDDVCLLVARVEDCREPHTPSANDAHAHGAAPAYESGHSAPNPANIESPAPLPAGRPRGRRLARAPKTLVRLVSS
ncbi:phosphoserine phosphatase RsbP [Capsulimonas corticalis]|uniref:Phosphoserine phosphatase RsbP n=1 Tax=Capsulimonas corticalis TaxID=2219043 RepID=A0A402D5A3_9BACT|nr:SpoIIE family protein phosphatase [Capsulimonas corticalis]BDI29850.1 phosphoserine phosphatase RsbP [Capsulimonas corticalis]